MSNYDALKIAHGKKLRDHGVPVTRRQKRRGFGRAKFEDRSRLPVYFNSPDLSRFSALDQPPWSTNDGNKL